MISAADRPPQAVSFLEHVGAPRGLFVGLSAFSGLVNLLALTGSFYMLQVYDRVIPSRSLPTLVALSILAAALFAGQATLDLVRGRILARVARSLDERLSPRVYGLVARLPLAPKGGAVGLQPLRDLDAVRGFLAGAGPLSFFDLPWIPLYLAICFVLHPLIGVAALAGAAVLVALSICAELSTRAPTRDAARQGQDRTALAEATRRNAEALAAMGMTGALATRWGALNDKALESQTRVSDRLGGLGAISRVARLVLQSGVLGLGAYLVIREEASAGVIIAGSILSARALAPVEQAIAHWRGFATARQSWRRLRGLLASCPDRTPSLDLPPPASTLAVESLTIVPPGGSGPVLRDLSLTLAGGSALGIVGPSASGKSSLARALVGIWRPARGSVRLDGASLDQWAPAELGRHIGYLPQDVELLDGTVAENIARFDPEARSEDVIEAAADADVHEMIVRMPEGYDTRIGEGGMALSAGQRQRLALARALYRRPFLIVLDEPNAHLDVEGEQALARAIGKARARGAVVIVIAHRAAVLSAVDHVLVLAGGEAKAFGPRDQVLRPAVPGQVVPSGPAPAFRPSAGGYGRAAAE